MIISSITQQCYSYSVLYFPGPVRIITLLLMSCLFSFSDPKLPALFVSSVRVCRPLAVPWQRDGGCTRFRWRLHSDYLRNQGQGGGQKQPDDVAAVRQKLQHLHSKLPVLRPGPDATPPAGSPGSGT